MVNLNECTVICVFLCWKASFKLIVSQCQTSFCSVCKMWSSRHRLLSLLFLALLFFPSPLHWCLLCPGHLSRHGRYTDESPESCPQSLPSLEVRTVRWGQGRGVWSYLDEEQALPPVGRKRDSIRFTEELMWKWRSQVWRAGEKWRSIPGPVQNHIWAVVWGWCGCSVRCPGGVGAGQQRPSQKWWELTAWQRE